jgi:signal transduction histidine kinase
MNRSARSAEQLAALAAHVAGRKAAVLAAWRRAVTVDSGLTNASALTRAQFYDHIPGVLDAFALRLASPGSAEHAEKEQAAHAASHGQHRWQQGYDQRELMREWRHLHLALLAELEAYAADNPALQPDVLVEARKALAELCGDGVCTSAEEYARMQRAEAAGRARDLEQALAGLEELGRRRHEAWRGAAHDLRGNLGVVKTAAHVLAHPAASEADRLESLERLRSGVESLHELLNELLDLARLEAGQEQRRLAPTDVAAVLRDLCANLQPQAAARGLSFTADGPAELVAEADAVKVRRVAQNLILNAIRYTQRGGVRVTWAETQAAGVQRWVLTVQDTGPGLDDGAVPPVAAALQEATAEAQAVAASAGQPETPAPTLPSGAEHRPNGETPGEGIGLSVVKRLCELLDAAVELETAPGRGTTFRVTFPLTYPNG